MQTIEIVKDGEIDMPVDNGEIDLAHTKAWVEQFARSDGSVTKEQMTAYVDGRVKECKGILDGLFGYGGK